jgi:hypothetical protein
MYRKDVQRRAPECLAMSGSEQFEILFRLRIRTFGAGSTINENLFGVTPPADREETFG